jgi:hypothetical protein
MNETLTTRALSLAGKAIGWFLDAWVLQMVWNWLLKSQVFHLNYPQAMAVLLISGILFRRNTNAKS